MMSSIVGDSETPTDFFDQKRRWSRVKDDILRHYLRPYLAKVRRLGKPVYVVDAFAGPGTFGDGAEDGSPFIIARAVAEYPPDQVRALFFNRLRRHHDQLAEAIRQRGYADQCAARHGDAQDLLRRTAAEIERDAPNATVFVFLDPFGASGIEFDTIARLLDRKGASTEFLVNIRASALHRMASARATSQRADFSAAEWDDDVPYSEERRQRDLGEIDEENSWANAWAEEVAGDEAELAGELSETGAPLSAEDQIDRWHVTLDAIFGKRVRWSPSLLNLSAPPSTRIEGAMRSFRDALREHTRYAGACEVRPNAGGATAHYITFCSRSPDALILMNDAMLAATQRNEHAARYEGTMFAGTSWEDVRTTPAEEIARVARETLGGEPRGLERRALVARVIGKRFVEFKRAEIRGVLEGMVRTGELEAVSPTGRFNERTTLRLLQGTLF